MSPLTRLSLLFAIFLDLVGFGMAFPDVQLRAEKFGASGLLIGAVLSSYFITQFFVSPYWGRWSDHIGRKPVLLICTALSAGSMVIYAFADSVPMILLSRICAGFAAANVVVAQAYLADKSAEKERPKMMGQMSSAILIGLIAGPAMGGYLASIGGNYLMGLTAATASALSLLWIFFAIPAEPPKAKREPGKTPVFAFGILRDVPPLRGLFLIASAGWFVLACLEGTFGRLIEHNLGYGQFEFGIIFSYESLLGAAVGLVLGWFASHLGNSTVLRLGYSLQGLGLGYMPFAPNMLGLLLASTLFAVGTGLTNPTLNSVGSLLSPPDRQGELFGVLQGTRSIGFFIGPVLGGILFDLYPPSPYLLAAGVALAAALLLRIPKKAEAPPQPQPA